MYTLRRPLQLPLQLPLRKDTEYKHIHSHLFRVLPSGTCDSRRLFCLIFGRVDNSCPGCHGVFPTPMLPTDSSFRRNKDGQFPRRKANSTAPHSIILPFERPISHMANGNNDTPSALCSIQKKRNTKEKKEESLIKAQGKQKQEKKTQWIGDKQKLVHRKCTDRRC